MARTLTGTPALSAARSTSHALHMLGISRLTFGGAALLGALLALLGTSWDIQWHSFVGRDRTLIPPHLMSLTGITLCGLAALASILLESLWVRRDHALAAYSLRLVDLFSGSLGAYVTGFAALNAGVAFPLDAYWHALYGIDVGIWEPFHVMILVAAACMPLGTAYMLLSGTHLLRREDKHARRWGQIGAVVALACTMGIFTYLLPTSLGTSRYLYLGTVPLLNSFPVLAALLVGWTYTTALYALSWRWAASAVVAVYVLFGVLFQLTVPPLMDWLVAAEHLRYLPNAFPYRALSQITFNFWLLMPIVVAPLYDLVFRQARKRSWSNQKTLLILALATLPACFPLVIIPAGRADMIKMLGIVGLPPSLLLGYGAACVSVWLGRRTGQTMHDNTREQAEV